MVVMSGEVGCCAWLGGRRVGVLVLSVTWSELRRMSSTSSPLWSSFGECQSDE